MRYLRYMILSLSILVLPVSSCTPRYKAWSQQRQVEKAQAQREREARKAYREAQRRHRQNQTREARQRMRETERRSKEYMGVREPFYRRWWRAIRR